MEDLSKFLPLYLGQKVVVYYENPEFAGNGDIVTLTPDLLKELLVDYPEAKVKIHCRPLSSMTEDEGKALGLGWETRWDKNGVPHTLFQPEAFIKLIEWGFDVFGLRDKGLALYPEDL